MDAVFVDEQNTVTPVMRNKAVARKILLGNIKWFTHEEYLTIFRESDMRKVNNR